MTVRTVLLVGYWFPPAVGAAARRTLGFSRYLSDFGWRPAVLTAGRSAETGHGDVLRVPDPAGDPAAAFADYEWPPAAARSRPLRGWLFPDRMFLWRGRARRAARRAWQNARPDTVLASFPPASAAALGADLAAAFGTPFVLDMRDLWLGAGGYEPPSLLHRAAHERLERRVTRAASAVVAVSDGMADFLTQRHQLDRARIETIVNGFDPEACPLEGSSPEHDRIVIAHVGTVIPRNRPDLFFDAVARAPQQDRWRKQSVAFRFVGNLSPATAARPELAGLVETTGLVPHEQAWRQTQSASALLLLVGDYVARWGHNAKTFEYLRSGRPILCLEETPDSNDGRLLRSVAAQPCVFARLNDAFSVAEGVDRIVTIVQQSPAPAAPPPALDAFDRRTAAARLASLLDRVVAAPSM